MDIVTVRGLSLIDKAWIIWHSTHDVVEDNPMYVAGLLVRRILECGCGKRRSVW